VGGFVATFVAITLGSHVLAPKDYVLLTLLLTFSSYVFSFASGGISNSLYRANPEIRNGRLVVAPAVDQIFAVIGVITCVAGVAAIGWDLQPVRIVSLVTIALFLCPLAFVARSVAFLNAVGNIPGAAFTQNAWRLGAVMIAAGLYGVDARWSSETVLLCFVIATIPLALWSSSRCSPIYCRKAQLDWKEYVLTAMLISLSGVSLLLTITLDRWFAAKTMPAEEAACYLFHISLIAGPMALVQSVVGFGLVPRLVRARSEGRAVRIREEIQENVILGISVLVALSAIYFVGANTLYRREFYDPLLFAAVLVTNIFRLAIPIPSAIIGGLATPVQLNSTNTSSWVILVVLIVTLVVLRPRSPYILTTLIGLAGSIRLAVWIWYARGLLRSSR
jgi:hypothetical protein